jgi:hypothetical protein
MLEWESWSILQHLMIFHVNRHRLVIFPGLLCAITLITALAACTPLAGSPTQNIVLATLTPPPPSPTIIWFPLSSTPSPQPLPTRQATPDEKPGLGGVILTDNFSSASDWNTAVSDQASVDVSDNLLSIAVQPGISAISLRQNLNLNDFYAEITARPSLCRGADEYGLLFRAPNNVAFYRFVIFCNGTTGVDRLSVKTPHQILPAVPSADVPLGAPGDVRLGVWAVGSEFHFFLNDHYQFSMSDKNYSAGAIGVFARSTGDTPVTVTFSDLEIYDVTYAPPSATPLP